MRENRLVALTSKHQSSKLSFYKFTFAKVITTLSLY
jgi:hypothetical protein